MRLRRLFERIRRPLAIGMALSATGLLVLPSAAAQEGVRLDTDLFGYNVEAEAAPLSVLFYENFIPLPVDPGDAQFQATTGYSRTNLNLGPQGVAVASNFWPGSAVGDGYGTVNCGLEATIYEQFFGPIPEEYRPPPQECNDSDPYPYEARASYPGSGEESWTATETTPPGATGAPPNMFASAKGLDVIARSQGQPDDNGAAQNMAFGAATSESSSVVTQTDAVATAFAASSDISIFSGVITIDSVQTRLRAVANPESGSTSGETTFSGIQILGQPVVFNENGAYVDSSPASGGGDGGDDDGGGGSSDCPSEDPLGVITTPICEGIDENAGQITDPLQGAIDEFNAALQQLEEDSREQGLENSTGINIEPARHEESIDGAVASRSTGGLVVTVNTPVLLSYLEEAGFYDAYQQFTNAFAENFDEFFSQLPQEMQDGFRPLTSAVKGYMVEASGLNPKIEYVFGRGRVRAGGSEGFTFEPPTFAPPPPAGITPPASDVLPNTPVTVPPPVSGGTDTTPSPPVAAPPSQTLLASSYDPPFFGGISFLLAAFALLVLAVPTWGLTTLRENAIGVNSSVDDGAPLPDLRNLRGGP